MRIMRTPVGETTHTFKMSYKFLVPYVFKIHFLSHE